MNYNITWKNKLFILLSVFTQTFVSAKPEKNPVDTSRCYPWLCPDYNYIQYYDSKDLKAFGLKWNNNNPALISIAHFGDSHVQPDIYSGAMRKRLQVCKGDAGFGMIFPFSTAKTYSTVDYKSDYTGIWTNSKSISHRPTLPLGIMGMTSNTKDSNARFRIIFNSSLPTDYRLLKLFCKQEHNSYSMLVSSGGKDTLVNVDSVDATKPLSPYYEIILPVIDDTITVQLVKTRNDQSEFEFYGMSLESVDQRGVLLHCMGVGGSQYPSLLWEDLFDYQLPGIHPDLAILDFGTNDIAYENKIPADLESRIVDVIQKIRRDAPECTVLLTSVMDMNLRGNNISSGMEFSKMIRKIAREQHCPFYDWYWISGGPYKMVLWNENGLAQNDMIHLKTKGYHLKGELFAEALINTMALVGAKNPPDSLIFPVQYVRDSADSAKTLALQHVFHHTETQTYISNGRYIKYKVQPGDNLGRIAVRFHTSIAAIQKLNGMKDTRLFAGKVIKIPSKLKISTHRSAKKPRRRHHRRR